MAIDFRIKLFIIFPPHQVQGSWGCDHREPRRRLGSSVLLTSCPPAAAPCPLHHHNVDTLHTPVISGVTGHSELAQHPPVLLHLLAGELLLRHLHRADRVVYLVHKVLGNKYFYYIYCHQHSL